MDCQGVAVGVVEEGLEADAGVERLALELDAARLELGAGGLEVVDAELDRVGVGMKLEPESVRLHDRDGEVAGFELDRRHVPPALSLRQPQDLAVEVDSRVDVLGRHGDEVGSGDEGCRSGHLLPPWWMSSDK